MFRGTSQRTMSRFYLLFSAAGLFAVALSYGIAPAAVLLWWASDSCAEQVSTVQTVS